MWRIETMSESAVVAATQTIHSHRALAEEGVQQFYACEGLPPPLTLWLRSPREGAKVADLLAGVQSHGPLAGSCCLWDIVGRPHEAGLPVIDEHLLNDVRAQIWSRAWGMTANGIGHQFDVSPQLITSPQTGRIPRRYPIWRNTFG